MVEGCWGGRRETQPGGAPWGADEQGEGRPCSTCREDGVSPKSDRSKTPTETEGCRRVCNSHGMGFKRKGKECL